MTRSSGCRLASIGGAEATAYVAARQAHEIANGTIIKKAGVPGMLKHDFRRTAVRTMVNKGIAGRVAMTVTGHRTRSVFDRYQIVSPGDLQDVARRLTGTIWAQRPFRPLALA